MPNPRPKPTPEQRRNRNRQRRIHRRFERWDADFEDEETQEIVHAFNELATALEEGGGPLDSLWSDLISDIVQWALENDVDPHEVLETLYDIAT